MNLPVTFTNIDTTDCSNSGEFNFSRSDETALDSRWRVDHDIHLRKLKQLHNWNFNPCVQNSKITSVLRQICFC